jgi:K+/H+ antiporter YhaU regulatory subunit KhtT
MLAEGLHVAETDVPPSLAGKTLAEAAIPQQTMCTVVALRKKGKTQINPGPAARLDGDAELIIICTPEAEERFMQVFGAQKIVHEPIRQTAIDPKPAS